FDIFMSTATRSRLFQRDEQLTLFSAVGNKKVFIFFCHRQLRIRGCCSLSLRAGHHIVSACDVNRVF
ncbi:MAG TPA: hypothetical protein VNQ90_18465, partial [Chthoniobacteraceae bacterium]|nr:hypothetical protein [Chthoniobacteraceae bacterium]